MIGNTIFREEALARRSRQEPLEDLLRVTAPHEWLLVAGLGAALLAVLAWSLFGSVERGVSFDAVLVYGGERHEVTAPASGTVVAVPVALGDAIAAGQAIARVRVRAEAAGDAPAGAARVADDASTVEILRALLESIVAAAAGYVEQEIVSPSAGELVALHVAPGQPVSAGTPVAGLRAAGGALEAHAYVTPGQAAQLALGMPVHVQVEDGRSGRTIRGAVTAVSARPVAPPAWLGEAGSARPHLVRVSVPEGTGAALPVADGAAARLRIVVGRGSFLSLLTPPGRG